MKTETDRLNRNRRRREDTEEEEPEEEEDHHHHHHDEDDDEEGNEEEDEDSEDNDHDNNDKEPTENVEEDSTTNNNNNPNNSNKKRRKSTHTNDTEDTYGADNRTSINRTTAAAVLAAAAAVAHEEQSAASSRPSTATNAANASLASSSHTTGREHRMSVNSQYTAATSSSTRLESFTEAVPLSLSSMAHASVPLEDGVLDGIKQMLHHTLLSCVNYARIVHPPHQWTFRDLTTSKFAWEPHKSTTNNNATTTAASAEGLGGSKVNHNDSKNNPTNNSNAASSKKRSTTTTTTTTTGLDAIQQMPWALQKMQFKHEYTRNALIYLQAALPADLTVATEMAQLPTWYDHVGVLGRVSLRYLSTEPLTQGEMDGTDTDDMPPCILYKIEVEYRSLPPTGNQQAVQAEELSMLSFGGSVDDDVKYGALASLYDEHAKYVLEIFSVRGKKYKFDLMDSTLSDGTIPHLPSSRQGDPFAKSLCVTVTDHDRPFTLHDHSTSYAAENKKKYAITRMHLLLEGKPRQGNNFDNLPAFDYIANGIVGSFLIFNPRPPQVVTAFPSGHALLLDPEYAGRIYVNGRYVTTWGQDSRIGSHGLALFGMDLHSIPFWHGRIIDYEALKLAYGQLWHEILIDARLMSLNIGGRLLARLMTGHDPPEEGNEEDLYDDDEDDQVSPDTNVDCLESQVMSSARYDPVGISPKALSTRFSMVYGNDAFPCLAHEMEWIKSIFPDRKPVAVPQRLIPILRRGGYFTAQQCYDELWFSESRPPRVGNERAIVDVALQRLEQAGCADEIALEQIAIVNKPPVVSISCIAQKTVCRFSEKEQMFCVHEMFFNDPAVVEEYLPEANSSPAGPLNGEQDALVRGYLLGMYMAKEHSNGRVLARYILRNNPL